MVAQRRDMQFITLFSILYINTPHFSTQTYASAFSQSCVLRCLATAIRNFYSSAFQPPHQKGVPSSSALASHLCLFSGQAKAGGVRHVVGCVSHRLRRPFATQRRHSHKTLHIINLQYIDTFCPGIIYGFFAGKVACCRCQATQHATFERAPPSGLPGSGFWMLSCCFSG